ncbi:unnamed protein product [Bemisia tabaci]|uniref:RNA helicase n=1 Tax=Bemisia tabaci TaxID=7038 RepID=A0A9P0F7Z5_BEMTA|nr:unnamed protein product [Bemisia tabaci]
MANETTVSFKQLNLNSWIIRQLQNIGLTIATPIQSHCIPKILEGKDCIGCAKTGSGKTLAFAIPILQKLCEDPYGIFALVLTPTRELAYQIGDQFSVLGKPMNLRYTVVTGGMEMLTQAQELRQNPHVVISTPGRLADHLESCDTFSLKRIKFLVLDEADRLLGGLFDKQIKTIFSAIPKNCHRLLFSATMTDVLETVKEVTDKDVFVHISESEVATVDELEQLYVLCPLDIRDGYLVEVIRLYREENPRSSMIIFTDTCKNCALLSMTLNDIGFTNVALHGMIPQKQRLAALSKFKSKNVKILIATDVASRGLDIPQVELVINHTIPNEPKTYVHRVGRTARAGRGGTSISLVTPHDIKLVKAIEKVINMKMKEFPVDGKEVAKIFTEVVVTKKASESKLDESDFHEKRKIHRRKKLILEGKDPDEIEEQLKMKRKGKKLKHFKHAKKSKTTEEKRL